MPAPEEVGEPVNEEVGVAGGVALLDRLTEAVLDALEPCVSEAVCEAPIVLPALTVEEGVGAGLAVPVPLAEDVALREVVRVAVENALRGRERMGLSVRGGAGAGRGRKGGAAGDRR